MALARLYFTQNESDIFRPMQNRLFTTFYRVFKTALENIEQKVQQNRQEHPANEKI